jgi:hypothetical protein
MGRGGGDADVGAGVRSDRVFLTRRATLLSACCCSSCRCWCPSCCGCGRFCALLLVFFVLTFSNSHSFCSLLQRRHGGSSGFPGSPRSHLTFRARQPIQAWYPRVKLFARKPLVSSATCAIQSCRASRDSDMIGNDVDWEFSPTLKFPRIPRPTPARFTDRVSSLISIAYSTF